MTESKKKIDLPFKIIHSEVSGGFIDSVHSAFTGGIDVVNYHEDKYDGLENPPLQSPFTERWVGGKQHRHVNLNTGSDTASQREEAWHTEFVPQGVRFYSHSKLQSPPAYWSREELTKRPINIKNIKNTELYVGNYSKNYQVIQTSGRRISNNLIVDGYEASGVLTTQFVNEYDLNLVFAENAILTSSGDGNPSSDYLGYAASLSSNGTVIAAGSPYSDKLPSTGIGSVVIYKSSSLGWQQDGSPLTSSAPVTNDNLGFSVSINTDGTIVAAGSPYTDLPFLNAGSVVIYKSSSLGWQQDGSPLTSSTAIASDNLGYSVAINSNGAVVAAGSPFTDIPSSSAGSVIVFKSSSLGWQQDGSPLTSSTGIAGDNLGYSVAISSNGEVIVAGVPNSDIPSSSAGSVIVFKSSSLGWYQDGSPLTSTGSGSPFFDRLGTSVCINSDGTIIAAGSPYSDNPPTDAGSIIIFKSSSLGWYQDGAPLTSSGDGDPQYESFGLSVAINAAGDVVIGGSIYSDEPSPYDEAGSVIVFKSSSLGWYQDGSPLTSSGDGDPTFDLLGSSVSISGDGKVIIAGSRESDAPQNEAGSVVVFNEQTITTQKDTSYTLPDLSNDQGKTVIVERFSAPGSKEESSRGALDREGEEMSPNIPLPYRNIKIRQPFYSQLSQSTPQFGGTIHGVNRNTLIRAGNEQKDNGFVVHSLPRTDIQYSWITASSLTTAAELGGYQTFSGTYNRNEAFTDITFNSGSLVVSGSSQEYFVDNYGINSLLKDKKQIDLDTKLFSISASVSASFSEFVNSPYTFTTWTSIRGAESPVARQLRKNNIISLQEEAREKVVVTNGRRRIQKAKRGQTSVNYTDPPVTYKYKPLVHRLVLKESANENSGIQLEHTFVNNLSTFANKELLEKLAIKEEREVFYQIIKDFYLNGTQDPVNPVQKFLGYSYRETIWPREQNTGLNETRKRAAYYLDRAGFSRDGFDIQLGTQRAFWRDEQQDRKRSKNSEGGYYSSINYLSTEETGSNFTQADVSILYKNKFVTFSSSFVQDAGIDSGLFNSIKMLENSSSERNLFHYSSSIEDNYTTADFIAGSIQYGNINKRSYVFDVSGEFNNTYIDFYEQRKELSEQNKKSIGAMYRATSYKSLLTSLPEDYTSYTDFSILTEDDQVLLNPKLKFVSFVGGGELNTSSFIQNESNFTNEYLNNGTFSYDYFSQSFSATDFSFSTLDNGLLRTTEQDSGKKPFFDSYEDFIEDIRGQVKEYSILPEFRISEHMDFYVARSTKNFRTKNNSFLTIDGVGQSYRSSVAENNSFDENFMKTYSTSDILKKEDSVKDENAEIAELQDVTLKVSGIKKLLPYNGFYPQDRTVQIANIYSDYVDNNLHGGTYNLSYFNDYYFDIAINSDLTTPEIGYMDAVSYNEKNYLAIGDYRDNSESGSVLIYSSSVSDPTTWSSSPIATIQQTTIPDSLGFGSCLKIISASNGLNLFAHFFQKVTFLAGIQHCTSSDGINWSNPQFLEVYGSSPTVYITGSSANSIYLQNFDLHYQNNEDGEKIVMLLGSSTSNADSIYTLTGSLVSGNWQWSDKTSHFSNVDVYGPNEQRFGSSVSIISCSSGYQGYFNALKDENVTADGKCVYAMTSSNGSSWSTPIYIGGGIYETAGDTRVLNVKAINYNDTSYVFFTEPLTDVGGNTDNGAFYVISSSANNDWGTVSSTFEKTLLYTNKFDDDRFGDEPATYQNAFNNISLFSGSDGRLYYCACNPYYAGSLAGVDQVTLGYTQDGINWQTSENEEIFYVIQEQRGAATSIAVLPYFINEYKLPIFFMNLKDSSSRNDIYALKNNIFTNFTLRVEDTEKFYKHAALEPFFAPGILYNTIKSGIAVDWPCATGSNTAIVPYGGDTIVNAYYPQTLEMTSFSGSNIYESMYGIIRSNIDYRIPFENILFPNEAFKNKDFLPQDLQSQTVLTTLPDTDPLVQFIDQTYIYGGYEPYISPIDFSDINNFGPKRFSVPFVYRRNDSSDTGLYTLAMSNFLAETVKFFLKDEKMVTFTSEPDYKWKQFDSNKTYYMDVVLEKSSDLVMIEAYHSELHPTGSNNEKMNGRYFGYPINKTDKALWGGAEFTEEERKLIHNDPAYAPYTPPYFEGLAKVRISFKPSGTSRAYTVQEIFDEATIENVFLGVEKGATTGSDAYVNKMPIGSSFDLFGAAQATEVTIDEITGQQTVREMSDTQNWIISPRMETPVLDFSSQSVVSYQNDYSKTGGFGRGMWSGYGQVPASGSGIKTRLEYPFTTLDSPLTASLLEQVGFKAEEKNIGTLADNKLISEAVVVIPYLEQGDTDYTIKTKPGELAFIKISRDKFSAVANGKEESVSISDMIQKMQKYVIPPNMNFIQYRDIDPFVMYIFEFEHLLSQQDLVDIWQGLMPTISQVAEKDEISIQHKSGPYEFFEGKQIPDNLRWLVFKVKKKAEINYFNVTATTKDDTRFNFNKIIGREEGTDVYSYNWPYDFFSLVEFAKIELKLDYKAKENE